MQLKYISTEKIPQIRWIVRFLAKHRSQLWEQAKFSPPDASYTKRNTTLTENGYRKNKYKKCEIIIFENEQKYLCRAPDLPSRGPDLFGRDPEMLCHQNINLLEIKKAH